MVQYVFCEKCGKVVDEYETCCYWCGLKIKLESETEK